MIDVTIATRNSAKTIGKCLKDAELREQSGVNTRKLASSMFNPKKVVKQLVSELDNYV